MYEKIFFLIIIFYTSCAKKKYIQFFYTNSINRPVINGHWSFENDTISISYNFFNKNGMMSFEIYNKLDKPIYIDWKNSSFIFNNQKLNYWVEEQKTTSSIFMLSHSRPTRYLAPRDYLGLNGQFTNETIGISQGNSSSVTVKAERVTFLPPKSKCNYSNYVLLPGNSFAFDYKKVTRREINRPNDIQKKENIFEIIFDKSNSPLVFRNFLAFTFEESGRNFNYVDNEFYLSKAMEMKQGLKPDDLNFTNFYIDNLHLDKSIEYSWNNNQITKNKNKSKSNKN